VSAQISAPRTRPQPLKPNPQRLKSCGKSYGLLLLLASIIYTPTLRQLGFVVAFSLFGILSLSFFLLLLLALRSALVFWRWGPL
jgi:hypothetical protein